MAPFKKKTGDSTVLSRLQNMINGMSPEHRMDLLKLLEKGHISEQRRHERKLCRIETKYAYDNHRDKGFIRNISIGGLFLETQTPLPIGKEISLDFRLIGIQAPFKMSGKIVRTSTKGVGVNLIQQIEQLPDTQKPSYQELENKIESLEEIAAEFRKSKALLLKSDKQLELALEGAELGLWDLNVQTGELYFNDRWAEILGYRSEEIEPSIQAWNQHVHPEDLPMVMGRLNLLLTGKENFYEIEYRARTKTGKWKWILSRGKVTEYDKKGNPLRATGTRLDITERRNMEEELLRARHLDSLGILAGGIAHDFNNFLTAIIGNLSLAQLHAKAGEPLLELLAAAEKASMGAKELTQKLITFSKGGAPLKKTGQLSVVIRESADFALGGSNTKCRLNMADDLWEIDFDENQIKQVLNNLIRNAEESMPDGGVIHITAENFTKTKQEIKAKPPLAEGNYVKLSISDQGIGIPKERQSHIFTPYFSTKEMGTQKGMGMGLATAYSIIKRHNGHIALESQVGSGTTFYVYLPVYSSEKPKAVSQGPGRDIAKKTKKRETEQKKILVMDDEKMLRDLSGHMLKRLGYDPTFAKDGIEAVDLYKEALNERHPFDVVILDLTIKGGMGGKETIQKLREIDPEISAVVSSGYSNDPVMKDYRKYGFKGVIPKPYQLKQLEEAVKKLL